MCRVKLVTGYITLVASQGVGLYPLELKAEAPLAQLYVGSRPGQYPG